jgi:hypothetical protein
MADHNGSLSQEVWDHVGPDTPLRLKFAVQIAFPAGGMTVSGLRKERDKGHLVIERIAGKDFTTLRDLEQMRKQCREVPKAQGSGLSQRSVAQTEKSPGKPRGSLETDRVKSARAALELTARGLNVRSPDTSLRNIRSRATADVIRLKS